MADRMLLRGAKLAALCVVGAGLLWSLARSDDAAAGVAMARGQDRLRLALNGAVSKNLDYAADWLSGKDFKTLAQTAEGMVFLSHVLSKQSTDAAWQEGVASFARNAQKLIASAQDEDAAACGELIGVLRKDAARLADWKPPPGDAAVAPGGRGSSEANPAGQRQRGSLRSFMALLDGTYADAKAALTFGEPQTAKSTAHVLHALGELLSNQRSDAGWLQHSRDFSQAALEAAQLESDDETAVRQKLRGVYDQCEKCHNRAR